MKIDLEDLLDVPKFAQAAFVVLAACVGLKILFSQDANFAIANSQFELSNSKLAIAKEANQVRELSENLEQLTDKLKLEQANNEKCLAQYVELESEFAKVLPTKPTELKHFETTVDQSLKQDLDSIESELEKTEEQLSERIDELTDY